jgi:hypothetical protein
VKFEELVDRVVTLPNVSRASVPYLVTLATNGVPTTAGLTLVRHSDGSFTATIGDLRTRIIPVTDSAGNELRFPSEDSACDWAWEYIEKARGRTPTYDPDLLARAAAANAEARRRLEESLGNRTSDDLGEA